MQKRQQSHAGKIVNPNNQGAASQDITLTSSLRYCGHCVDLYTRRISKSTSRCAYMQCAFRKLNCIRSSSFHWKMLLL